MVTLMGLLLTLGFPRKPCEAGEEGFKNFAGEPTVNQSSTFDDDFVVAAAADDGA